jgi:hypothetical protein
MKTMSIRGIEREVAERLESEARWRGISINAHVLQLLRQGVGLTSQRSRRPMYHDLDALAGTWSEQEAAAFEEPLAAFEQIDDALWR